MNDLKYKIVFTRRRSLSIIVSPSEGVTVRAPFRTSLKRIDNFVKQKSDWIIKHLERYSDLTRINHKKIYQEGEPHFFLGKELNLKLIHSPKLFVRQYDNTLEAGIGKPGDSLDVKRLLDHWYREEAMRIFSSKLSIIIERYNNYGFSPSGFSVRPMKSRWGSCTSKGRITLNSDLVKLDERLADYVIIHELCHLKFQNHGKEFYRLLGELVPDYKSIRKELKKFITR